MKRFQKLCLGIGLVLTIALAPNTATANGRTKLVQETAEYLIGRFGRSAFKEGVGALAVKIEQYAVRHGADFVKAVRQVGPRAFHLVESAGAHSKQAVSTLAKYGEHGAAWVVARPSAMKLAAKHGFEETAAALVKHKSIAEPLVASLGKPAVKALEATGGQSARRLAMLVETGELAKIGRSPELLDVVARHGGDRVMNFIWENKGALATATVLSAFLLRPEPFINGTERLVATVADSTVKPLAQIPANVATEAARMMNWTLVTLGLGGAIIAILGIKYLRSNRDRTPSPTPEAPASA